MFPLIQNNTNNSEQSVLLNNNTQLDSAQLSKIFILPHVESMLTETYNDNTHNTSSLDNFVRDNSYVNTENMLNFPVTNQNSLYNLLNDQVNIAIASQSEFVPTFEITNELKNYATVNTLENIPNQISYNLGTESVDADETLNNTETVGLEESSIITEIENSEINMFDIVMNKNMLELKVPNFDVGLLTDDTTENITNNVSNSVDMFTQKQITNTDSNAAETSVQPEPKQLDEQLVNNDLVNLNKQIRATEAIEMSLVCEEEVPSQWVDVMSLATSQNTSNIFEPPLLNENPLSAIPTAIQSYINIEIPQHNVLNDRKRPASDNGNLFSGTESLQYMISDNTSMNYDFSDKPQEENEIDGVINETINKITEQKQVNNDNIQMPNEHTGNIDFNNQTEIFYILPNTNNTDILLSEKTYSAGRNILKNLTADANICRCVDCKCGTENNCSQGFGDSCCSKDNYAADSAISTTTHNTKTDKQVCNNSQSNVSAAMNITPPCSGVDKSTKQGCCNNNNSKQGTGLKCNCSPNVSNNAECCVMVCLKSLDQLRQVLSLANKCCALQSLTMGFTNQADTCAKK